MEDGDRDGGHDGNGIFESLSDDDMAGENAGLDAWNGTCGVDEKD